MKNYEKYADEIREKIGKDEGGHFCSEFVEPYILKTESCFNMNCDACHMLQTIWLLEEYEEPEVDWNKVKVDTPILVGEGDGEWVKRYFAEYKDGIVFAWCGGATSWNSHNMMMAWKYAKLAESEETK